MPKLTPEENSNINQGVICDTRRHFERAGFKVPRIARELALIAYSDMADFIMVGDNKLSTPIPINELKKKKSRIIKKLKSKVKILHKKEGGNKVLEHELEYELHDKLHALNMAIEILGIKKPLKVDLNGKLNIDIASAKRKLIDRVNVIAKRRGAG